MNIKKSHDLSRCRICGDVSAVDEETWELLGLCAPCQAPAVQNGHIRRKRKSWHGVKLSQPGRHEVGLRKTDSLG